MPGHGRFVTAREYWRDAARLVGSNTSREARHVRKILPLLILLLAERTASSGKWPTPAAGPSRSGDPEVLFTFDDGPAPGPTDRILATLKKHDVRAIFFMVGRRLTGKSEEAGTRVVNDLIADGHLPANHTVDHVHLCQGKAEDAAWQIDENARIVEKVSKLPPVLFRAPYGNKCKRLEAALAERRIAHFHWDIDPQEWKAHDAARTRDYVINKMKHLKGRAVILLHDIHGTTASALPGILEWIEAENVRREKHGGRPIRILDPSDVMLERVEPAMLMLLTDVLAGTREAAPRLLGQVVTPIAPTEPAARARL